MNTPDVIDSIQSSFRNEADLDSCWLVVINRNEACIYHSLAHGTVPEHIQRQRTQAAIRHSARSDGFFRRPEVPAPHCYLEPLARVLKEARRILVFGSGKGVANQMDQFVAWLDARHPDLARRILGRVVVDEHHMTASQLLARARAIAVRQRASIFETS